MGCTVHHIKTCLPYTDKGLAAQGGVGPWWVRQQHQKMYEIGQPRYSNAYQLIILGFMDPSNGSLIAKDEIPSAKKIGYVIFLSF